jgi:amylosucrase
MIMSFGGIPLLYYGDELGTTNDMSFLKDKNKSGDTRWAHRTTLNWERAEHRHQPGTIEHRIFTALKKMIAVRKEISAFADFNNRELIQIDNSHLFVFSRYDPTHASTGVLVVGNFDAKPQYIELGSLSKAFSLDYRRVKDLYSGDTPAIFKDQLVIPPFHFYWLSE